MQASLTHSKARQRPKHNDKGGRGEEGGAAGAEAGARTQDNGLWTMQLKMR